MRETTITTDKNNFVFPPRKPRSDRGDVGFTSCSRCFPIDTQAIRNKILDLAIRGKLTEQLPEDGSAEELYRQIQAKKSARTKGGKRKEETYFQKIGEDEIPFAIPKNWKWIRLNDLGIFCGGKTPSMANHSYWKNGSITWVTSKDMKQKYIHASEMMITEEASRELTLLPAGTVLFVVRSGILRRLFPVAILTKEGTINQDLKALKLFVPGMCEFVYCLLKGFETTILFKYTKDGTTVNNIVFDELLTMPVPLPPLPEQQRIVESIKHAFSVLDTIDVLQAQYADNLAVLKSKLIDAAIQGKLTEQLPEDGTAEDLYRQIQSEKQALIKEGKIKKENPLPEITADEIPFEIPANWKWVRIGTVLTLQSGKNIPASEIKNASDEAHTIPCYGGNGQRGFVNCANVDGFHAIIGRQGALCGNINFAEGPFYATEHAVVVYGYAGIDMKWVGIALRYLNLNQYATSVAQPGLAVNKIDKVLMPLPPRAEQKRIFTTLEKLLQLSARTSCCGTLSNEPEHMFMKGR